MDGNRFDGITRSLAVGTSRRELLRKLGGGVAGGALAMAGLRRSGAAPAAKVGICHRTGDGSYNYIEVSGNAVPAHTAHGDVIAPDFQNDPGNCGFCGNVCTTDVENAEAVCVGGECGYACTPIMCDPNFAQDLVTCGCICAIDADDCGDGATFDPESCACIQVACTAGTSCGPGVIRGCNDNTGCFCGLTPDGTTACGVDAFGSGGSCSLDDPCPDGEVCMVNTCAGNVCVPVCPESMSDARMAPAEYGPPVTTDSGA